MEYLGIDVRSNELTDRINDLERLGRGQAVVALAREIAVLLHRLWVTG